MSARAIAQGAGCPRGASDATHRSMPLCPRFAWPPRRHMKRGDLTAARRYARALLDVSFASGDGDPAALRRELQQAADVVASRDDLAEALASPAVPADTKRGLVDAIWREGSPVFRRLLGMLVERRRMPLLPALAAAYTELWNAARGVVPAEAT